MKKVLILLLNFLPLYVLMLCAFWNGAPSNQSWINAYKLGALVSTFQILFLLIQKKPLDRLMLGVNLYLIVGGGAAFLKKWSVLDFYSTYSESVVLIYIFFIGLVTTLFNSSGFFGIKNYRSEKIRFYSILLLFATGVFSIISYFFRGNFVIAGVIPILMISLLSLYFSKALEDKDIS